MEGGDSNAQRSPSHSPIVRAIALAQQRTTGEVRVDLSRKLFEKDPYGRALRLFSEYGMTRTTQHNAVLIYVNLRKRRFAIVGDSGIQAAVGQQYWEGLGRALSEDLRKYPKPEQAIAMAVTTLGATLQRYFPSSTESG